MYLMDASAPRINNRKWNLGRLRGMGLLPVRLPNLGFSNTSQPWRRSLGRLGRLGQAAGTGPVCVYYGADGTTIESVDYASDITECAANGGVWNNTPILNTPTSPGLQNPSPVAGGASNGGITTVRAGTPSQSPLDYVSPQAAIAAGLDPKIVYAAWSAALARFPSPQAAISAGVPAGVVNQLWQQSNVNAANAAARSAASTANFGTLALWGGGALLLLEALRGGRR
jgi:hypothetical protein